jgi:cell division protein FtsI/penicillin-binding protein 2
MELRRSRVLVAAAGLFIGLALLWARVAWLQLVCHAHFVQRAEENQEQRVLQKPVRGNLLDRRGRLLARDLQTYRLSVAPREMRDVRVTARDLGRLLGRPQRALLREFERRPRYLELKRRVPPEVAAEIAALGHRGVYLTRETGRMYPLGPATLEVLGRTNADGRAGRRGSSTAAAAPTSCPAGCGARRSTATTWSSRSTPTCSRSWRTGWRPRSTRCGRCAASRCSWIRAPARCWRA